MEREKEGFMTLPLHIDMDLLYHYPISLVGYFVFFTTLYDHYDSLVTTLILRFAMLLRTYTHSPSFDLLLSYVSLFLS